MPRWKATFEAVSRLFNQGTRRGLNVFEFARLLGRARALRALAALPNWAELHVLLHALVALIQRAVRDEYDQGREPQDRATNAAKDHPAPPCPPEWSPAPPHRFERSNGLWCFSKRCDGLTPPRQPC